MNTRTRWCLIGAWLLAAAAPAFALDKEAVQRTFTEARAAALHGPADVALLDQAVLHVPAGRYYVPEPHATRVLNAMGNPGHDERLQGVVFPENDEDWLAIVRYEPSGYIKDGEAKEWNADDLLTSYREGTEAANAEREKMGVPPLEIVGWAEKPAYDGRAHRLVWAMSSRHKGAAAGEAQGVNYNTYALGREGYFSLNLVTELNELPQFKGVAQNLLGALDYKPGKAYGDFTASTDRVAEYGLAALVVGVGAKKLGLLALAGAFIAKFAKLGILAAVAFGGGLMKLLGRKKKPSA